MGPHAGESVGAILSGQWKLLRLIGEGGLAAVYEAEGLQGQGRRAIKLLHPQFVTTPAIVERFYAEAKTCYSLRHPHICAVEAYAYAEDGSPYIVMDLLEGMSLEDFLQQDQVMQPAQAALLLGQILDALSLAHAHSVIHRDLKPANIFLVPTGAGGYSAMVLDFGIAKVMDLAGGMGSKTRTGSMLGTPGYMSPEQVRNAKAVDVRSDLWAAGVVFYEMLTGQHPFGSESDLARMVAVLRAPATPIAEVAPHLASWDGFFQRALARDPDARFQSAQEMGSALGQVGGGQAVAPAGRPKATEAMPAMPDLAAGASPMHGPGPSTSASPAVSAYGDPNARAYPSNFPPSAAVVMPPDYAGALRAASATQISADRPEGTPTYHSDIPPVHVMSARDEDPPSLVWWAVVVIAVSTFAFGVLLGYLLGAS